MGSTSPTALVRLRGLSKVYDGVVANDAIDLDMERGEVLGLVGENGAGKSTLISILSGMTGATHGSVEIDGVAFAPSGPSSAIQAGIGTAFQHGALVPTLTVSEQLVLANVADDNTVSRLLDGIDRAQLVRDLSVGERQRLEIVRAVGRRPRVLLLDEPTSTLDASQVEALFAELRVRRTNGDGTVFVTHKLGEALAICDRIVVLRRGAVAAVVSRSRDAWSPGTEASLLDAMFGPGRSASDAGIAGALPADAEDRNRDAPVVLAVEGVADTGPPVRHRPVGVSMRVRAGEILAIAGIEGQGQRELGRLLAGHRPSRGVVSVAGVSLAGRSAAAFADVGVGYLTGDRRGEGIVARLSVGANLLLKRQRDRAAQRFGVLRPTAIREAARREIDAWGIRPADPGRPAGSLSGGNMQKVLLARELARGPIILVADNPNHGLDVQSQARVAAALRSVTRRGGAVVLLTADLDEAIRLSDQVAVMNAGRLSVVGPTATADRSELSRWMVGGW